MSCHTPGSVVLAIGLLMSTGCRSVELDFKELCREATAIDKDKTISQKESFQVLVKRTQGRRKTDLFKTFFRRFQQLEPQMRYDVAQRMARSHGLPRWTCPPLERIAVPEVVVKQALSITDRGLIMGNKTVVKLARGGDVPDRHKPRGAGDPMIEPLRSALQAQVRTKTQGKEQAVAGTLALQVHPATNHRTVMDVLHSAEATGFRSFDLSLPGGGGPLRALIKRPRSARRSELDFTVGVLYQAIVFTGKDLHYPPIRCKKPLKVGICPEYDYAALARVVTQTKRRFPRERLAFLVAYRTVPFKVVMRMLKVLQGRPTVACTGADGCLFDRVVLRAGVR